VESVPGECPIALMRRIGWAAVLGATGGLAWGWLHRLGRTWGSTPEERDRHLAGDDLVPGARVVTNHATTIRAPAEDVWPWLVQMGWHRGGWYTYRWVDRLLFPANGGSADSILPEWQGLKMGDHIPDGGPETGCFFNVEILEPNEAMVLRSWTHLPAQMRRSPHYRLDWTWAFCLDQVDDAHTRLLFRTRANLTPAWLRAVYWSLVPADFVMGRSMCLGVKRRAEGFARTQSEPALR
jgi:hypothetical protein